MSAESTHDRPMRVGAVPYLNGQPLTAWFDSHECDVAADVVSDVPSRLAGALRDGSLDVALVSSIEAFRDDRALAIPGVSVSAHGAVRSVRMFSRIPPARVRTVATDSGSLTSSALIRILMQEIYGSAVNCIPMAPDAHAMLACCDAALLIGDRALGGIETPFAMDLGEAWLELTGLPFVFALWVTRDERWSARGTVALNRARDWGCARLQQIADDWSLGHGLHRDLARDYVANVIRYDLDERKRDALTRFGETCVAHGLVEGKGTVRYADPRPRDPV